MHVLRQDMVQRIVDSEARRDQNNRVIIYMLDPDDGGGLYEVAGVNEKYHKSKAARLKALVESGEQLQAEREAHDYIASYTDKTAGVSKNYGISYCLRDAAWNRGPSGSVKILQMALGVGVDGDVGPQTKSALALAEANALRLLNDIRESRERYERQRGRDESSRYWRGLVARWDRVLDEAIAYHEGSWIAVPIA